MHEEMITETDSLNTIEFDAYYVILPSTKLWDIDEFRIRTNPNKGKYCEFGFKYNSGTNTEWLTIEKIRELIKTM